MAKLRDAVLGALEVEEGQLTAWRKLRGQSYELLIVVPDLAAQEKALVHARAVVKDTERHLAALRGQIADALLALCNRWRKEAGAKPVSRTAFLKPLQLMSVTVEGKAASLIFECGDLFEDHGIEVCLGARGGVGSIDLC